MFSNYILIALMIYFLIIYLPQKIIYIFWIIFHLYYYYLFLMNIYYNDIINQKGYFINFSKTFLLLILKILALH